MMLETISLTNWKDFRQPVEYEFSPGLNVIHGPNESGKSTLIEAISMVLFNKHTSKSQEIKDLIPWSSKLYPQAQISFQEGGETYRITKQFINPESILEKYYDDRWNELMNGDKADNEVLKLLRGKFPSRGSKSEYWGLGQSLWMVQGQPQISEELNSETVSSLKVLIGAAIESKEEKKVLELIRKEFSLVFTEAKRNLRSGSQLFEINKDLMELKNLLNETNNRTIEKEEIIRNIEDKELSLRKKKGTLETFKQKKLELKDEVKLAQDHREERQELQRDVENLNSQYDALKSQIDDIKDIKSTINDLFDIKEELQLKVKPLEDEFEKNKEALEDFDKEMHALEQKIDNKTDEKRIAGIIHTTVMEEQTLQDRQFKLEYVNELANKIKEKEIEINTLKSPSSEELRTIEELTTQIRDTETRLDAIGLTIETNLQEGVSGKMILDGEESINLEYKNNISKAHQSVELNMDKIGYMSIKSGSQDVKEMRENLEDLEIKFQEVVAPYNTIDPIKLRDLYNQKVNLENDLIQLTNDLTKQAKNGKEALEKEVTRLKRKIELNWDQIPPESPFRDYKIKSLVIENLSEKINQIEEEIDDLKGEKNTLRLKLQKEQEIKEDLQSKIASLNEDIRGNKERLEQIEEQLIKQESDGLTAEKREENLNKISQSLERKERALKIYNNEIEEKETKPLNDYEAIENTVDNLQNNINELEIKHSNLKKDLDLLINNSGDLNKLEEELINLEKQYKELETDAKAIELLYDLTTYYRESTIKSLGEPVEKILNQDLEKLLGPRYCFNFGKEMKPETLDVVGSNNEATLNNLSVGAQEQIWCLFRLALGRLLSAKERQLVILDDPLVNTDESRFYRALEILEDSAHDVQLILVTCDVDKYSSLNAKFIGLER